MLLLCQHAREDAHNVEVIDINFGLSLFLAKKYKKVTGKEIYSDTLESTPMLEKEKFPQDYFPEVCTERWSIPKY